MISSKEYVLQFKNSSLEECIKTRDSLIEEIRLFENDPIYDDDGVPSALTRYLVCLDYLKELNEVISRKICANNPHNESETLSRIEIKKIGITDTGTEAVVNAANSSLQEGSGVCGAIFAMAGSSKLQNECDRIGHCNTGSAVLTSGYNLCDYIIHAVGPIYKDGKSNEPEQLHSCYIKSLDLAKETGVKSIAFPLISSGIYGYPKTEAWKIALKACDEWIRKNRDYAIEIIFAIIDDQILKLGKKTAEELKISIN